MCAADVSSQCPPTKLYRNIPSVESDESSEEIITVRDVTHPLFGRTFSVIRRAVHRGGGFPVSYEVAHGDHASLLIPVASVEPEISVTNRIKLSVEALNDLISEAEQVDDYADQTEGPLGDTGADLTPSDRRRNRSRSGGVAP
jgi:hypothetical protein